MELTIDVPDSTTEIILNVIYINNGQKDMISGIFVDPEENDLIDMMPSGRIQ